MSFSSFDWDTLIWYLKWVGPSFLFWCLVIYFCIARQRENPKGAVYLSLAVLVSFSITVFNLGWSYVMTFLPNLVGSDLYSTLITVLNSIPIRFSDVASFAVWVLITLAVFARPSHSRYVDGPALDD